MSKENKDPVNEFFGHLWDDYKSAFEFTVNEYKSIPESRKESKKQNTVNTKYDEEYIFPYHNDIFKKLFTNIKNDIVASGKALYNYKTSKLFLLKHTSIMIGTTIPYWIILKDWKCIFYGIGTKQIIQALYKALADLNEIKKIQDRLIPYFKEDIIVTAVKYEDKDKEKGIVTVKSKIPFPLINRNNLEHSLNYSIINILQDKRNLHKLTITIEKGKIRDYLNAEKGTIERLEAILRYYKDNPRYVETREFESDTQHVFISRLGEKRLRNILQEIPSRLGVKKEALTIDFDEDKTIFTIKNIDSKQYFIDDFIREYKRPNNLKIPFIFGINRQTGKAMIFDYDSIQHMLIGGMTGSGKSSVTHGILYSLMYWNDDIFFYMIDLKGTELPYTYKNFNNCKVVGIEDYESEQESINAVVDIVQEVHEEYRKRVRLFNDIGCKDLKGYNLKVTKRLPTIIFLIDEVNYLFEVMQKTSKESFTKIESNISTLLSRGRSTGIYSIHTMQNITDKIYNITWRRSMMTRLCMKMAETKQCQMIIENNIPLADKAYKQGKGEYIVVKDSINYELQNLRVNDELQDQTYINLLGKYGKEEDVKNETIVFENETEIIEIEEKEHAN